MKGPTDQQTWLGWEHLILNEHRFRCKWHTKTKDVEQPPFVASEHMYLTHALHSNGNLARHWDAECGQARETLATGTWILSKDGTELAVLTLDYVTRDVPPAIAINRKPVKRQERDPEQFKRVIQLLRNRGTLR